MMYGYDFTTGSGWFMVAAMAIVAAAILGSVWLIVHRPGAGGASRSTAVQILEERFARGEITPEQFEQAKKILG